MDKERRNNLRRVINRCRKILEEDVERGLLYYGIKADGPYIDIAELKHLTSEDVEIRKRVELAVEKEIVGGLNRKEAVERYIRHTAFTFLNRIAALRAMEVRGLIKETIIQRSEYGGRSLREREIAEARSSLSTYEILKETLIDAFKEVSEEIKILFDANSEYSIIFPSERAIREIIKLLTEDVSESDWKEDDIIGWIYQYFNDEARKEYRKAGRKPRPDDIPVINQFYTPHWIVKALVDNTLGRLWVEIHPESKIKDFCSYLVPLKNEVIKRKPKRVREIKVLDPACGSGHFLVYAFDVLYRMYQEDEPETPAPEIPALILENNLFGIDIDLYSVQLAALSLYLKAKMCNPNMKIRRMNIVCADIRISDGKKRLEFLERFKDDPDLREIFNKLFEYLSYTYEIGSLLKVRQPFEQLFKERKSEGKQARLAYGITGQTQLSRQGGVVGQTRFLVESSKNSEPSVVLVIPKERTIEEMLEELREFEREAIEAHDMGSLLFATEAEKSVGLLALLSEKYDIVLMNPPYGEMTEKLKEYASKYYSVTKKDYYTMFIEQAIDLTTENGFIGMLTSRTYMFLESFKGIRSELLQKRSSPILVIDTGFGVLDGANVETAATILTKKPLEKYSICTFCNLTSFKTREKSSYFVYSLKEYAQYGKHELWYDTEMDTFYKIPDMPYAYRASISLMELFKKHPPLDKDSANISHTIKLSNAKMGLSPKDTPRFIREFWEVQGSRIGKEKIWAPYVMGGLYSKFYANIDLVIKWQNNGEEIKKWVIERYPYLRGNYGWIVRNEDFYFREGLTWTLKPAGKKKPFIAARYLPPGIIFSVAGYGLFPEFDLWRLLSFLCSKLAYFLCWVQTSEHNWVAKVIGSLPITKELLNSETLAVLSHEAHDLLCEFDTGNEISIFFIEPWILQVLYGFNFNKKPITGHPLTKQFKWSDWSSAQQIRSIKGSPQMLLKELAELCVKRQLLLNKRIEEIQKEIDEEVYRIYGISDEDRALIEKELALQRRISLEEETEAGKEELEEVEEISRELISAKEHVKRLISFYIKKALESDEDGIVPLDEMFQDNLFNKVREFIAQDFGKDRADKVELEISEILGKSLKQWIEEDYFDFHVTLYKRRPIFWQLTSSRLGKSKLPGVFSCFLYYHKLSRDTIPKILAFHLKPIKERLFREKDRTFKELEAVRASGNKKKISELSKAYGEVLDKINEIEEMEKALNILHNPRKDKTKLGKDARWVEKAIAEVRDNGWNPIIDYGVRVNIEPLKELKILHPAADRVK